MQQISRIFTAAAIALMTPTAALAACPDEHKLSEPRELNPLPGGGVKAPVIGSGDLTGWRDLGNFRLRMRKITVAPGGVVPVHSHDDRPSIVYIVEGEIVEYNAFCAVPITHKTGDAAVEIGPGHKHWWQNKTDTAVVIISSDVLPFEPK
ncbi:MAG: cupin domain-containing protein [Pseudomonadota bacterium]